MSPPRPTIMDGAIGTELVQRGFVASGDAWTAHASRLAPHLLAAIHADYARAGATVHIANTFRAQPRLFPNDCEARVRETVSIARQAVPASHLVVGSLAPIFDCYRPDLAPDERLSAPLHDRMARALEASHVDAILCEGFASAGELKIAVRAAAHTRAAVWAAMHAGPDGALLEARHLATALRGAVDEGASRVFVHCIGVDCIHPWVEAVAALDVPFGVYANAGDPSHDVGWGRETEGGLRAYGAAAREWQKAGATMIGGCCGTSARHIGAVLRAIHGDVRT